MKFGSTFYSADCRYFKKKNKKKKKNWDPINSMPDMAGLKQSHPFTIQLLQPPKKNQYEFLFIKPSSILIYFNIIHLWSHSQDTAQPGRQRSPEALQFCVEELVRTNIIMLTKDAGNLHTIKIYFKPTLNSRHSYK